MQGVQISSYETDYGTGHTVTIQAKPIQGWSIDYIEYERDVDGVEVESIRVSGDSSFTKSFTAIADSEIDIYARFFYKQVTRTSRVQARYIGAFQDDITDEGLPAYPIEGNISIEADDWFRIVSYDLPYRNTGLNGRCNLEGPDGTTYTLSAAKEARLLTSGYTDAGFKFDMEFFCWNSSFNGTGRWPSFIEDNSNPIALKTINTNSNITLYDFYRIKRRKLKVVCVPWYGGEPLAFGLSGRTDTPGNNFSQDNVHHGERKFNSYAETMKAADGECYRVGYASEPYGMAAAGCIPAVGFTPCYVKSPTGETYPMVQGKTPWGDYQAKPEQWWCNLSASHNYPGYSRKFQCGIPYDDDCVLSVYLSGEGLLYNVDNDKLLHGTHETNNGLMFLDDN